MLEASTSTKFLRQPLIEYCEWWVHVGRMLLRIWLSQSIVTGISMQIIFHGTSFLKAVQTVHANTPKTWRVNWISSYLRSSSTKCSEIYQLGISRFGRLKAGESLLDVLFEGPDHTLSIAGFSSIQACLPRLLLCVYHQFSVSHENLSLGGNILFIRVGVVIAPMNCSNLCYNLTLLESNVPNLSLLSTDHCAISHPSLC